MEKIVLIGGGGHCKVIIDAIILGRKYDIAGIIDIGEKIGGKVLGISLLGDDTKLSDIFRSGVRNCIIAVGSIGDPSARIRLFDKAKKAGFSFPNIIHPGAVVSRYVEIGSGNYIAACAAINAGVKMGDNCIINTSASVDHDCKIGDFVHIAPGATLSGGVKIGDETHIATGANIIQYINIGRRCLVGAGVTIRHDMSDGQKNFGKYTAGPHEKE